MIITYLGKLSYSNGNYELRVETKANNVLNTGYGFQDFAGIMLLREKNVERIEKPQQIYAGIWDNKPLGKTISTKSIQVDYVKEVTYKTDDVKIVLSNSPSKDNTTVETEPQKAKETGTSLIEKIGNLVSSKKEKLSMASTGDKVNHEKDNFKEDRDTILDTSSLEKLENETDTSSLEKLEDEIDTSSLEKFEDEIDTRSLVKHEEEKEKSKLESCMNAKQIKGADTDKKAESNNYEESKQVDHVVKADFVSGNKDEEANQMNVSNVINQDFVHLKNTVEVINGNHTVENIIGKVDTHSCVDDKLDCMNVRMAKAEELRERFKGEKKKYKSEIEQKVCYILQVYPKMNPFEDDCECVRIEPQDLYGLPISVWMPVNNNFLKNGYNKFKHLVLTRNGSDYVIGVPGIRNEREQFMAYLHGFTTFKPLKKIENVSEEFGYWVAKINI